MIKTFFFKIECAMKFLFIIICCFVTFDGNAEVELPLIFADGMVLQQNQVIPIWGWANEGEEVTVKLKNQRLKTVANHDGKWKLELKPEIYGGPFVLEIVGSNIINIKDVYIGEVWVCSGQSNMEFTVDNVVDAQKEMADSNYPLIRQFVVERDMSMQPKDRIKKGSWSVCNPKNVKAFTAVGYFFAKKIHQELNVPIGIINTTWGGTVVESWISTNALSQSDEFSKVISGIPKVDLDSLMKIQQNKMVEEVEAIQGRIIGPSEESRLRETNFNDSEWPELTVPGLWENQKFPTLDGLVWMRKTIQLSKEDSDKEAILELSKIDDSDITYVNGKQVGSTDKYDLSRVYNIPNGLLKPGNNVIAVRITDTGGGGGIYGDASDIKLTLGNKEYSLSGKWKYNVTEVVTQFSPNSFPSLLFNTMINPLIPYGIKGVLWYQGESNVHWAAQYKKSFPLLINDWRAQWQQGDFPFYFVQLSSYDELKGNSNNGSKWAELRESQTYTSENVKNTGMCVTIDVGNAKDIHPRNKQTVGYRLAAIALNKSYGKDIISSGPKFKKMEVNQNKVVLKFNDIGSGLIIGNNASELLGFEIAGEDQIFYKATATIINNLVILNSKEVTKPIAVRYGWADDAGNSNLYNQQGFPAIPFRNDKWDLTTERMKYSVQY